MQISSETYQVALDLGHAPNPLLYESAYGGLWLIKMRINDAPLEDLLVRKALAHGQDMRSIVRTVWGPTATHAKGVVSSPMACHDPDVIYQPYDPDLARELLSNSSYGSGPALPLLMIDFSRPNMVAMGQAVKEYWKDNLDVELDVLKLEGGMVRRREASQLYRSRLSTWIPDPIQIVNSLTYRGDTVLYNVPTPRVYLVLDHLVEYIRSLQLDHPERCSAFGAVEDLVLDDEAYMIPIREVGPVQWVVQPWLRGFESTFNLDFNTLTTAYVARH